MSHHVCKGGCAGVSDTPGVCQAGDCADNGKPLVACDCVDGQHGEGQDSDATSTDEV